METEPLKLCLFNIEETAEVAKNLGFDLRKTKCCVCGKRIGKKDIGHFVHYKKERAVLCCDTNCFSVWYIEEKIGDSHKN